MTTIYIPVLIESAEQAESLPEECFMVDATNLVASRWTTGKHAGEWSVVDDGVLSSPALPATAFLPVEVEVEHIRESGGRRREKTLYVTDWSTP